MRRPCRQDDDDGVDHRRGEHQLGEAGVADLGHGLRGGVDRVLRRAVGRQMRIDTSAGLAVELRHLETGRRAGIRHPAAPTAGGRADADSAPVRQPLSPGEKAGGHVDHLVDVAAFNEPVALEHRPVGGVGPGERGSVRCGRPHPGIGLADLVDDDGLAGLQRLLGHTPEGLGALDVLQQQE